MRMTCLPSPHAPLPPRYEHGSAPPLDLFTKGLLNNAFTNSEALSLEAELLQVRMHAPACHAACMGCLHARLARAAHINGLHGSSLHAQSQRCALGQLGAMKCLSGELRSGCP